MVTPEKILVESFIKEVRSIIDGIKKTPVEDIFIKTLDKLEEELVKIEKIDEKQLLNEEISWSKIGAALGVLWYKFSRVIEALGKIEAAINRNREAVIQNKNSTDKIVNSIDKVKSSVDNIKSKMK